MRIGILALQGAVVPHQRSLAAAGAEGVLVRTAAELDDCAGLIIPGGESSTMLNLIHHYGLWEPLDAFAATRSVWGVCAGSILMAKTVEHPRQESFGWLPVGIRRNAYGRQNESFIATVPFTLPDTTAYAQECVFIRAPLVTIWDEAVTVLGSHGEHPIALVHGRHMLTTFHPELSAQTELHGVFAGLCSGATSGRSAARG